MIRRSFFRPAETNLHKSHELDIVVWCQGRVLLLFLQTVEIEGVGSNSSLVKSYDRIAELARFGHSYFEEFDHVSEFC